MWNEVDEYEWRYRKRDGEREDMYRHILHLERVVHRAHDTNCELARENEKLLKRVKELEEFIDCYIEEK